MRTEKFNEAQKGKIAVLVIIILFALLFLYSNHFSKSLLKHFIVTRGFVTKAGFASSVGGYTQYTFLLNGKFYKGSQGLPQLKDIEDRFVIEGKIFPVIVDTSNYLNSKMLFDSLSFVQYGLQYPDSLRWLQKYLK